MSGRVVAVDPVSAALINNRNGLIAVGTFLIVVAAIAIAALIIACQNHNSGTSSRFMARTMSTGIQYTGGVGHFVTWDTQIGSAFGFTYEDGRFIASKSGVYVFAGNLSVNVSGTGGGGTTLAPVTATVVKNSQNTGGTQTQYATQNFSPIDFSIVAGNSQYITWSTLVQLDAGESLALFILSPTFQQILGGPTSYAAIGISS
jgi:hypothetical protein